MSENPSNFEDLDPEEQLTDQWYSDPTPDEVQPDDINYVEPAVGCTPILIDRGDTVIVTGNQAQEIGACYICGDLANHGGVPHNEATGENKYRADIL